MCINTLCLGKSIWHYCKTCLTLLLRHVWIILFRFIQGGLYFSSFLANILSNIVIFILNCTSIVTLPLLIEINFKKMLFIASSKTAVYYMSSVLHRFDLETNFLSAIIFPLAESQLCLVPLPVGIHVYFHASPSALCPSLLDLLSSSLSSRLVSL